MTPEERRAELRRKAGLDAGPMTQAAPVAPDMNISNAPDPANQRRAELRAKAGLGDAPSGDPSLDTVSVPDRMFGLPMPYSQGETDIASNAGQGYQIALPSNAPQGVQRGIMEGVQSGRSSKQRQDLLAERGASVLDQAPAGRIVAPLRSNDAFNSDGGRNKTLERLGAQSAGLSDVGTFGFSDEIIGAVEGPSARDKQRQTVSAAWEEHPVSTAIGAAPTLAIPGQNIRGASTLARAGRGMLRGGAFGGAYGYGSGEGGALSGDRLTQGAGYGVSGGALGGGFVLGSRGLDFAGRKILGSAELRSVASHLFGNGSSPATIKLVESAITEVQRAARVEGRSIARDVAKKELTDAVRRAEANDMLGDLIPGGVTSMEGSALPGMEGADMVVDALRSRGEGQYDRINAAVGKIVDGEDIESSLANLAQIKQEEAGPLYSAAFAADKVVDPAHPRFSELRELIKLDDFKRGRSAGERVWRLETGNSDAQFNQLNPFEQIDWIKKGLDAEIGKLLRAGDNTTAGAMIGAKNKMLAIADDMNPEYAQARQVWSGAQGQQDALLLGESLFNASGQVKTGQSLREIRQQYDSFSEAQKTAFSIGLFEKAMSSVGTVIETGTANSAKRGFLSPNSERALRDFLPQEQADDFLGLMQREYRQQMNANQALAGSPSGRRIMAGEAVRMATGGARAAAAELSDPQGLLRKAQQKVRDTIGNNPKAQRGFAEFLTQDANDPNLSKALGLEGQTSALPPPNVPSPKAAQEATKGSYSAKDKALDATALGLVASGATGTADAQQASGLEEAQGRVSYIENEQIRPLESDLQMLNDPNAEPRALQEILKRRVNPDLKIDGVVGPQTLAAIGQLRGDIQTELQTQRGELEKAQGLVTQAQQRQVYADNQTPGWMQTVQDQAPLVGTGLGLAIGMRGRGGAVAKSKAAAKTAEDIANNLINTKPIAPTRITGPNSINERAPNINEFWRLGGAGENVPFKTKNDGTWVPRPNPVEPSNLYKPNKNPFRTSDLGWIGGGLGEAGLSTQYLEESKAALKEARIDAERYQQSGDIAAYEDALARVRQKETEVTLFTTLQRLGLATAGGRLMGALKSPYASARPNIRGAEMEQGLVRQGIRKKNAKPPGGPNPDNGG